MPRPHTSKRIATTTSDKAPRMEDRVSNPTSREAQQCFVAQSQFGRRLCEIRERIVASGQPLLNWDQIEQELLERGGERRGEI